MKPSNPQNPKTMYEQLIHYIRSIYGMQEVIPLHEPRFSGNERQYLNDAIDSTFVSSIGKYVDRFEGMISSITGAKFAVATVNGTSALHIALKLAEVRSNDEVISSPLTFVATANAIRYCDAQPIFLDVEKATLGLNPVAVRHFLQHQTRRGKDGFPYNRSTGRRIAACVPVHTFGHPCRIDEIVEVCNEFNVSVVEDAAESLGSLYRARHTGTFGKLGIYSLNGNKTITCGGGGVIVTNDASLAKRAKHLTTTAKIPHPYEYVHDEVGYNYRMPNLNAALACAQLEQLEEFVQRKRDIARNYSSLFEKLGVVFVKEPDNARSNYWLNAIILENIESRNRFLETTHDSGIMTRPIWRLLHKLPMFRDCQVDLLLNAQWLEERVVNIPSSVPL